MAVGAAVFLRLHQRLDASDVPLEAVKADERAALVGEKFQVPLWRVRLCSLVRAVVVEREADEHCANVSIAVCSLNQFSGRCFFVVEF